MKKIFLFISFSFIFAETITFDTFLTQKIDDNISVLLSANEKDFSIKNP